MEFNKGDEVLYNSLGRPYLADLPGEILSFNLNKSSALVRFTRPDGSTLGEWVGVNAIKLIKNQDSVEVMLRKELREVTEEFTTVSAQYRKLNSRKSRLEAALRALNATFR